MAYFENTKHDVGMVYESDNAWNEGDIKISKAEYKERSKQNAIKDLERLIGRNKKVYTTVTHVSSSGMTRHIKSSIVVKGDIVNIDWYITRILDWPMAKNGGIVVGGCGMDMGFHLIYTLSSVIYGRKNRGGYELAQQWL